MLLHSEEETREHCDVNAARRWSHSLDCFFYTLSHTCVS